MTTPAIHQRQPAEQWDALRQFASKVLWASFDDAADIDGSKIFEWAIAGGLLDSVRVDRPCSEEECTCAESGDFPSDCYRPALWLSAAPVGHHPFDALERYGWQSVTHAPTRWVITNAANQRIEGATLREALDAALAVEQARDAFWVEPAMEAAR